MKIPSPGTTIILRQKQDQPYDFNFNNKKPDFAEFIVVILRETNNEVVVQLKSQPIEAYIPKRYFLSKGADLSATPPVVPLPPGFTIETLPI